LAAQNMKFGEALDAHSQWSLRFKDAIARKETLDIATISAVDRCEFGKWLRGEAQAKYGTLDAYADCVTKHTDFHRVASQLAQQVNAGNQAEATTMLQDGSPYAKASIELGTSVIKLRIATAK
jgi:hypothetical protein